MLESLIEMVAKNELASGALFELQERGFVVIPGPVPSERMGAFELVFDAAVASATGDDIKKGSTSTRVNDFVNRGALFDDIYIFPALLAACSQVIGRSFKLSSLNSRTLRPCSASQVLHVDVHRDSVDWPLVGFILMVDEFRSDNGATRFVPGSHHWLNPPKGSESDLQADYDEQVLACGTAGSLLIFNGSAWHGYTANLSNLPRRSIQGAFIPRNGFAATDFAARMQTETFERLSPLAKDVLGLGSLTK